MSGLRIVPLAITLLILPVLNAQAAGDPAKGKAAFVAKACAGCHQVGPGAKNAFGPVLNGVVGRQAGSYPQYTYSAGLKRAGAEGLVWNETKLAQWLSGPTAFLKSHLGDRSAVSKMPVNFPGDALQANLIAYLKTLK